jgi:hypothetical protein
VGKRKAAKPMRGAEARKLLTQPGQTRVQRPPAFDRDPKATLATDRSVKRRRQREMPTISITEPREPAPSYRQGRGFVRVALQLC